MRTTKRRFEHFQFYNSDGIEAHLAKMASRGWQLKKITPFYWCYQKIEPQALHYSVTYFSEASEFNPKLTENQEVFHAYCEDAGWDFIAQWAQLQIFCSSAQSPTPIETDELTKLQVIHRAMKKNFLPTSLILVALSLLQVFYQLHTLLDSPIDALSNRLTLSGTLAWSILALCFSVQLIGYFLWYRGSQKSVALGGGCLANGRLGGRISFWVLALSLLSLAIVFISLLQNLSWALLVGIVPVAATLVLVLGLKAALKRKQAPRRVNFAVTLAACLVFSFAFTGIAAAVIFSGVRTGWLGEKPPEQYTVTYENGSTHTWDIYKDTLPLTVEDLQDVSYEHYSYRWQAQSSCLLAKYTATQRSLPDRQKVPNLEYEIVEVKLPALFAVCLNDYLDGEPWEKKQPEAERRSYRQVEQAAWQADAVYRRYYENLPQNNYLLCWGNRLVQINFDEAPTDAQIKVVAQKLNTPLL